MISILLDRSGDTSAPRDAHPDWQIVDGERDALLALLAAAQNSTAASTLLVRGAALCDWTETAAHARGWNCAIYRSPLEALQAAFPRLASGDAQDLLDALGDGARNLAQPLQAADLLEVLHPDFDWHEMPSAEHAARWLLWLDAKNETDVPAAQRVLLTMQVEVWRARAGAWQSLYAAQPADAAALLSAWFHIGEVAPEAAGWGVFPLAVPAKWAREAAAKFGAALLHRGLAAWDETRAQPLPPELCQTLAGSVGDYLTHHAGEITPRVLATLDFLPHAQTQRLRALRPPQAPPPLPSQVREITSWIVRDYLPFRVWQSESGDEDARRTALLVARTFGEWFLKWYAGALSGGYAEFLATKRAEELRCREESSVVFWIIADGLGWRDAQTVSRHLTTHSPRFTQTGETALFTSIPTLTRFAKPALRWGVAPAEAESASQSVHAARKETEVAGHRAAQNALSAAGAGDIVIWKPLEPDKTYHETADAEITRANVAGRLRALAENIAEAALAVPSERSLRLVLTTDHGRLWSHSPRTHAVPAGFQSSGRAAFEIEPGAPEVPYNSDGWHLASTRATAEGDGGEIAWLDPVRFGLSQRCILALDEACFVTNGTARSGDEAFPHGGVFPEEVLVPWFEFARDATFVEPEARLSGRARADAAGVLGLHIQNVGALELRCTRLNLRVAQREYSWPCEAVIAPFSAHDFSFAMETWPGNAAWKNARATLHCLRPGGSEIEVEARVAATSEAMQTRDDDILSDL